MLLTKGKRKAREKRNVFSLDVNTITESLLTTVFGSEFEIAGTEHQGLFTTHKLCLTNLQFTTSRPVTQRVHSAVQSRNTVYSENLNCSDEAKNALYVQYL